MRPTASQMSVTTSPRPDSLDVDAGVIEEARASQRRHRVAAIAVVGVAVALVAGLLGGGGRSGTRGIAAPRPVGGLSERVLTVAPAAVFARPPAMGLACASPQDRVCKSVAFAIWLRTRAAAATANFDGQSLALDNRKWSDAPVNGKHKVLVGFLQPGPFLNGGPFRALIAGMGRMGWQAPTTRVHLVIDYGPGHRVQTNVTVVGYGGWGYDRASRSALRPHGGPTPPRSSAIP